MELSSKMVTIFLKCLEMKHVVFYLPVYPRKRGRGRELVMIVHKGKINSFFLTHSHALIKHILKFRFRLLLIVII